MTPSQHALDDSGVPSAPGRPFMDDEDSRRIPRLEKWMPLIKFSDLKTEKDVYINATEVVSVTATSSGRTLITTSARAGDQPFSFAVVGSVDEVAEIINKAVK